MTNSPRLKSKHPYAEYIERIQQGKTLLPDTPENVLEVVGILKSYGVVMESYYKNLLYIAEWQFLELFPFFKYFNGQVTVAKVLRHWWHDRINFEYAEYCMKVMQWHGGGGLDTYLESETFRNYAQKAIDAKTRGNFLIRGLNKAFPEFLLEQVRQSVYYSVLGQFWDVMCEIFLTLSDLYDLGTIKTIPQVVEHVKSGLVAAASKPIVYTVDIRGQRYDIIPKSAELTFLADAAIPYVETIFFRGTPFLGTVSYNAQAQQIPFDQGRFAYGALYADPLPTGGAGIPPTLLMQDMRHFIPDYLHHVYQQTIRKEDDLLIKICESFQKSMFCVTNATILGLMPHPSDTLDPKEQRANLMYLQGWMDRLQSSRLESVQIGSAP
ncbi:CO2 hydration protein [Altericista sp. CCNU0014]|uniref:CO2 hydration protein n=1 Tax=Altericista sp. CCNU0014 TaxID=3082949 RepID=UPI00384B4924